jgi:ribosomal-protein-alanine N-acetyltransferase
MAIPADTAPGGTASKTGAHEDRFLVASVSHLWLRELVAIDSTWNPRSWSARLFSQELVNEVARVKGLFVGSSLVGYLIAHILLDEAHIVSFGLAPEWRGKGGGRYLLGQFLKSGYLEGVRSVTLDVRLSNERAQSLYERAGFCVVGIRRHYYSDNGEDALTMRCELRAEKESIRKGAREQIHQTDRGGR